MSVALPDYPFMLTMEFVLFPGFTVSSGKIKKLGASNFTASQLQRFLDKQAAMGYATADYIQNNHNLAHSDITDEVVEICSRYGVSICSYSPLAAGFLTGKYQRHIPSGSRFDIIPQHRQIYFNEQCWQKVNNLRMVAAEQGIEPAILALAWAMQNDDISTVLIGCRNREQIDQAFTAYALNRSSMLSKL